MCEMGSCRNNVLETRTSGVGSVQLTDARITTKIQPHSTPVVCAFAARHWVHRRALLQRCQVDLFVFHAPKAVFGQYFRDMAP